MTDCTQTRAGARLRALPVDARRALGELNGAVAPQVEKRSRRQPTPAAGPKGRQLQREGDRHREPLGTRHRWSHRKRGTKGPVKVYYDRAERSKEKV